MYRGTEGELAKSQQPCLSVFMSVDLVMLRDHGFDFIEPQAPNFRIS